MTSPDGPGHLTTDELFRQHAGFVARFLSRLGVPSDQLEDALQEVFLVVHKNGGYRPGLAKPTSYLANIAIRAAARHRRRDGLARQRHSDASLDHVSGDRDDPARSLQVREDLERLQRALARLPEELCTVLLLVEMEGESCVSVAAGLGCPIGTIYWRLHHARKELRAALRVVDGPRRARDAAAERLDERAQPARSWMIWFGLDAFDRSEASRLLQLARALPAPLAGEALLARHHALVRAGAELPAWASGLSMQSASWLSVIGAGPLAVGVAGGVALAVAGVLAVQPALEQTVAAHAEPPRVSAAILEPGERPSPELVTEAMPPEPPEPPEPPAPAAAIAAPAIASPAKRARPQTREGDRAERRANVDGAPVLDVIAAALSDTSAEREPARRTEQPAPEPAPREEVEAARPERSDPADEPIGRALSDQELAEMRAIARAERLLAADPKRALALTRAMAAGFPRGHFNEERAYLEVMALEQLGRADELRDKAAVFLDTYPAGLYSERVRKALAGRGE